MVIQFKDGKPLIVMGKVAMNSACCCGGTCSYTITAFLVGDLDPPPDVEIYGKMDANATVYQGNVDNGDGGLGWSSPFTVQGLFSTGHTFKFWWNRPTDDPAGWTPDQTDITIQNQGTGSICVNGTTITAGNFLTLTTIESAGVGNGDQSAYAGGTEVVITCGACP